MAERLYADVVELEMECRYFSRPRAGGAIPQWAVTAIAWLGLYRALWGRSLDQPSGLHALLVAWEGRERGNELWRALPVDGGRPRCTRTSVIAGRRASDS